MTYLVRHWRGDLSLPIAFWVNGVLGYPAIVAAIGYGFEPLPGGNWLAVAVLLALVTWQVVGIWRSAGTHSQRGGRNSTAVLAQGVVVVFVLFNLGVSLLIVGHLLATS